MGDRPRTLKYCCDDLCVAGAQMGQMAIDHAAGVIGIRFSVIVIAIEVRAIPNVSYRKLDFSGPQLTDSNLLSHQRRS